MSIASRFSIAVHILTLLDSAPETVCTSEWMAGSIGVNPVIVRSVTGQLRRAGLAQTRQGIAGAHLARPLPTITLLDVYRAVEADGDLFSIHNRPNPACPVGAHIQSTLEHFFGSAQQAMEERLQSITLDQVIAEVRLRAA